jgi:hypothetical protein
MTLRDTVDRLNFIAGFADVNYNWKLDIVGRSDTMAGPFEVSYLSVFEEDSGMVFREIYRGDDNYVPNWVGDSDRDGLMEVFLRNVTEPNEIHLWESIDSTKLPMPPVDIFQEDSLGRIIWSYWGVGAGSSYPYPEVEDLDGDGTVEFLFFNLDTLTEERFLDIVEVPENNTFQVRQRLFLVWEGGLIAVSDFDGDAKMEMILGSAIGDLYVYEAMQPDSFALTEILHASEGSVYRGTLLHDVNQNGRDEFACGGGIPWLGYQYYTMYEATGDNEFSPIWSDIVYNFPFPPQALEGGDVDGDGIEELVIDTDDSTRVYDWSNELGFQCVWGGGVGTELFKLYDTDLNMRSEIWYGSGPTYVYEMESEVGVEDGSPSFPKDFDVSQNYPNPFNAETTISFQLAKQSPVRLVVYNLLGMEVREILDGVRPAGSYKVNWNGQDGQGRAIPTGTYFCRFESGGIRTTIKMVVLK